MTKQKTPAPINNLIDQSYKLSYFSEDLSKYVENQLKSTQTYFKISKTLNKWFKKNILHIEMFESFCPECFSKFVNKNGVQERTLYFHDKGAFETEIQSYKCKNVVTNSIQTFPKLLKKITILNMILRIKVLN